MVTTGPHRSKVATDRMRSFSVGLLFFRFGFTFCVPYFPSSQELWSFFDFTHRKCLPCCSPCFLGCGEISPPPSNSTPAASGFFFLCLRFLSFVYREPQFSRMASTALRFGACLQWWSIFSINFASACFSPLQWPIISSAAVLEGNFDFKLGSAENRLALDLFLGRLFYLRTQEPSVSYAYRRRR